MLNGKNIDRLIYTFYLFFNFRPPSSQQTQDPNNQNQNQQNQEQGGVNVNNQSQQVGMNG